MQKIIKKGDKVKIYFGKDKNERITEVMGTLSSSEYFYVKSNDSFDIELVHTSCIIEIYTKERYPEYFI